MESLSDEDLVARYRAEGSLRGQPYLNELFRRHYSRVGGWCYRLTGDRESAADLAQEVFTKAYQNVDSFRGDSKFTTWLYTIARNHCFNEMKARAIRPQETSAGVLQDMPDGSLSDPLSALEHQNAAELARELMQTSLEEVERKVMTLHYVEEFPLDAITRLLGLTNSSGAKAYIVSARRKLSSAVRRLNAERNNVAR